MEVRCRRFFSGSFRKRVLALVDSSTYSETEEKIRKFKVIIYGQKTKRRRSWKRLCLKSWSIHRFVVHTVKVKGSVFRDHIYRFFSRFWPLRPNVSAKVTKVPENTFVSFFRKLSEDVQRNSCISWQWKPYSAKVKNNFAASSANTTAPVVNVNTLSDAAKNRIRWN